MVGAAWSLVWRRQRLLWWLYLLSLAIGFFATSPLEGQLGPVLDHSLASGALYHGFSLAAYAGLMTNPAVSLQAPEIAGGFFGLVFLVLMILLTGGILRVYNEDRTCATGEFFGACGQYFWRFVRLLVLLLLALIPPALIYAGIQAWSNHLSEKIASPAPGLVVGFGGTLLALFLFMGVRLWVDMAEVIAVAENVYAWRSFVRAFRLTWHNFGSLYWLYFRPSFLAWIGTVAAFWVWVRFVPPEGLMRSFLVTQFVIFLWIFTRLWQRAGETLWYQANAPAPEMIAEPVEPPLATLAADFTPDPEPPPEPASS